MWLFTFYFNLRHWEKQGSISANSSYKYIGLAGLSSLVVTLTNLGEGNILHLKQRAGVPKLTGYCAHTPFEKKNIC